MVEASTLVLMAMVGKREASGSCQASDALVA